jgi:hypothetical protein
MGGRGEEAVFTFLEGFFFVEVGHCPDQQYHDGMRSSAVLARGASGCEHVG